MSNATRHPLTWPAGRLRHAGRRQQPKFKPPAFARARDDLLAELRRLGARGVILSTNVALRGDGLPLANQRNPDDPGVAVYFTRKGKSLAFACDRWYSVEANMRAIADAIECIRTIERRGTGDMVDAAFTGFAALPPARTADAHWSIVLGVHADARFDDVTDAYRKAALVNHPDRGGDQDAMIRINDAYEKFKKERGL